METPIVMINWLEYSRNGMIVLVLSSIDHHYSNGISIDDQPPFQQIGSTLMQGGAPVREG